MQLSCWLQACSSGSFDTHTVEPNPSTIQQPAYDRYNRLFLPTEGASGGAAGQLGPDTWNTADIAQAASSSGGGLIWLSASSTSGIVTFGSWVALKAEGLPGGATKHVSGGGAGGQILIFATKITTDEEAG